MRKTKSVNGEYYHIYNRGVDKRIVFLDRNDFTRFLQSMREFNDTDPAGGIYAKAFLNNEQLRSSASKLEGLVKFLAYCLNPNHYHFLVQQISDNGVEKFMHRLGTGYTKYFNHKHKRNGALFQGKFKVAHIETNEKLLYMSAYVNLNNQIHQLRSSASKSSWSEYQSRCTQRLCDTVIVLSQFDSRKQYYNFSHRTVKEIVQTRSAVKEI